jgi:hypothetical protein
VFPFRFLAVPVVLDAPTRSHDEIMRKGGEERAWRALPWWRKVLRFHSRPQNRLSIGERIYYITFDNGPVLNMLREKLYDGTIPTGKLIEVALEFGKPWQS